MPQGSLKTGQSGSPQNRPTVKVPDIDSDVSLIGSVGMSNVLSEEKKQQVIALGKLGWPLRQIERATGVRRETAGAYLKAAGIAVRPRAPWGRRAPAKPVDEVTPDLVDSKPANEVTPTLVGAFSQRPSSTSGPVSACEPYRDLIEEKLGRRTECQGHLAGPGYGPRIWQLPNCKAFRTQAWWFQTPQPAGDHPHRARGRSAGRLRQWPHGARPENGQVPEDQAVRVDPGIQPQMRSFADVAFERAHLDGCVEVEAAYYSLPPGWIGRLVKVQWDELHVRLAHPNTSQLLREHLRQKRGGYRIEEEDNPKKMPFSTAQLLRRAEHAGAPIGTFRQLIYHRTAVPEHR